MKIQIIAAWLVMLEVLPRSVADQDWSSWITSDNHDVQYRRAALQLKARSANCNFVT